MPVTQPDLFASFRASLAQGDIIETLRKGLIGDRAMVPGPNGPNPMIYADYVASGRALWQVEDFVAEDVLPYYANSHTEASYCGQMMTRMRRAAREVIKQSCGAGEEHGVIFTGAGATAGINRLVGLLGVTDAVRRGERPLVLIGPYEHHSNILPWRESGAEVIEIAEAADGGPDLAALEAGLAGATGPLVIGAFSAASNVTGIVTDVEAVTRVLKRHGALSVWDYAGGAPYLPIAMSPAPDARIDAVVISPHKFIGGPGASGVMILRRDAVSTERPTLPGGGTVRFVSPATHDFSTDVVTREEAGTPNVIGDIRAALTFIVKDAIGPDLMASRLEMMRKTALATWRDAPGLHILVNPDARHVLPIFSFLVTDPEGRPVHQHLVTRMLSDHFGIQGRGGCACAGPYGHRLLGIDAQRSAEMRQAILAGHEIDKPGWTRLGLSVLMDDAKVAKIIESVAAIARDPNALSAAYTCDETTARFSHAA